MLTVHILYQYHCMYHKWIKFFLPSIPCRKPRTYEGVLKNLKSNLSTGQVEGDVISIDCDKDDDVARSFTTADIPQPSLALVPMSRLQRQGTTTPPPLQTSFPSASTSSPRSASPSKHHDSATPKVTQPRKADSSSKVITEVSLVDSDADDEDMIVDDRPASRTAVSTSVRSDNIQNRCIFYTYIFCMYPIIILKFSYCLLHYI